MKQNNFIHLVLFFLSETFLIQGQINCSHIQADCHVQRNNTLDLPLTAMAAYLEMHCCQFYK